MFKVLIADDEDDIRNGLLSLIDWRKHGFTIVGLAEDGNKAMDMYIKEKPSLVITDIRMPGMNGLELARQLKLLDSRVKILIVSGYNDFSYAKEAIKYGIENYLLKPVDVHELCKELEHIRESIYEDVSLVKNEERKIENLQNYFMIKLVNNNLNQNTILKEAINSNINLDGNNYCPIIFELAEQKNDSIDLYGYDFDLKKFLMKNILQDILPELTSSVFFEISELQLGLLLIGKQARLSFERIKEFTTKAITCINAYAMLDVWMGVGKVVDKVQEVAESFRSAKTAIDMRFYDNFSKCYFVDDIIHEKALWTFAWDQTDLINSVSVSDREYAAFQIELLFAEYEKAHFSAYSILHTLTDLIIELAKITIKLGGDWESLYAEQYKDIEHMIHSGRMEIIKQHMIQLCYAACSAIEAAKDNERSIEDVIRYIDQSYRENLNLKKLSDMFYINSAYLGKLIKKRTNRSFNEYLNEIRILNAIKLLDASYLSISDISERVGYNYIDHFYRNFKRITGKNPGSFRNNPL